MCVSYVAASNVRKCRSSEVIVANIFSFCFLYVIVVTHPRGLYLICKCDAQGQGVYKSDTNRMGVLQLLCINSA